LLSKFSYVARAKSDAIQKNITAQILLKVLDQISPVGLNSL
jgi:hypothetical protein